MKTRMVKNEILNASLTVGVFLCVIIGFFNMIRDASLAWIWYGVIFLEVLLLINVYSARKTRNDDDVKESIPKYSQYTRKNAQNRRH